MGLKHYFLIFSLLLSNSIFGQSDTSRIAAKNDSIVVNVPQPKLSLIAKARKAIDSGQNKEAFTWLQEHEARIDSIQRAEKKDTLESIISVYSEKINIYKASSEKLRSEIIDLDAETEKLNSKEKNALYSYIGLPVASLVFLLICLQIGIRTRKRFKTRRDKAAAFLTAEKQASSSGRDFIIWSKEQNENAFELTLRLQKLLEAIVSELPKKPKDESEYSPAQLILIRLKEKTKNGISLGNAIIAASYCDSISVNKNVEWDLNLITRQATDLCTFGETASLTVQFDLEKSLPYLKKAKEETISGLVLLLSIALKSIHQANSDEKYKPVLSVASRVLPSFLQVRIKDNGKKRTSQSLDQDLPAITSEEELLELLQTRKAVSLIGIEGNGDVVLQGDPVDGNDILIKIFRK